jgi:hypothetical protein
MDDSPTLMGGLFKALLGGLAAAGFMYATTRGLGMFGENVEETAVTASAAAPRVAHATLSAPADDVAFYYDGKLS